jgi:hypothetical protein
MQARFSRKMKWSDGNAVTAATFTKARKRRPNARPVSIRKRILRCFARVISLVVG